MWGLGLLAYVQFGAAFVSAQASAPIIFSEVELNPPGTDAGNEWVELYNDSDQPVDVSGWRLQTTAGETVTVTLAAGSIIAGRATLIVQPNRQWLDNQGERVLLLDAAGRQVAATPVLDDPHNDERTWQWDGTRWVFRTGTRGLPIPEFPLVTPLLAGGLLATVLFALSRRTVAGRVQQGHRM